jgi:hypothetical protein
MLNIAENKKYCQEIEDKEKQKNTICFIKVNRSFLSTNPQLSIWMLDQNYVYPHLLI